MKKYIRCLTLIFLFSGTALAFEGQPRVNVSGTGFVEVVPDEMHWTLRVENNGPDIKELAVRHSEVVSDLIATLKENRVAEEEIQTTRMRFGERWEHHKGRRIRAGFFSSSTLTFKLTDFDRYQPLWEILAGFQGMNIQDVAYDYSKRIAVQNEAGTAALKDAENKAKAMAGALGCEIGTPLFVEEVPMDQGVFRAKMAMAESVRAGSAAGDVKSYSPGKIKIEARVNASFSLDCAARANKKLP